MRHHRGTAVAALACVAAIALSGCADAVTGSGSAAAQPTSPPTSQSRSGPDFPVQPSSTARPSTPAKSTPAPTATTPTRSTSTPTKSTPTQPSPTPSKGDTPPVQGEAQQLGRFVGVWGGHGRAMLILGDGSGSITYRAYTSCDEDPTPPCDTVEGNEIHAGGRLLFRITAIHTDGDGLRADVQILDTNDPGIDTSGAWMRLSPDKVLTVDFLYESAFCTDGSPNVCGA